MTPILLDTNAYVALRKGSVEALSIVRQTPRIGVSVIMLGELLGGFRIGKLEQENRESLKQFLASPRVEILHVDEMVAQRYADLKAQLRSVGKPIPTNDLWIAATAVEHGLVVYSYDVHFQAIPGLTVITKLSDLET